MKDPKARRKGDAFKVRTAAKLRALTTVTAACIAKRLHMGTRGHLSTCLKDMTSARGEPGNMAIPLTDQFLESGHRPRRR